MTRRYDLPLFFLTLTLVAFGLAMVYSASAFLAVEEHDNPFHYLTRQGVAAVGGAVGMLVLARLPYRRLRAWAPTLYIAVLASMPLVWVPGLGHAAKGAARWFGVGGLHIQPAEALKVVLLICLATLLHRNRGNIHDRQVLVNAVMIFALPLILLMLQPDFGSTAIIVILAGVMLYFAGIRRSWVVGGGVFGTVALLVVALAAPYRVKRLMSFLAPFAECKDDGYQVCQSLLALHHGGLLGQGPGESAAKLLYLPEPYNDFIAAIVGEELGLWGMVLLLGLYGLFAWRGFSIARRAADPFGALQRPRSPR